MPNAPRNPVKQKQSGRGPLVFPVSTPRHKKAFYKIYAQNIRQKYRFHNHLIIIHRKEVCKGARYKFFGIILQRSLYIFPDSQYAEHRLQELAGEESPEVALDAEKGDGIENEQKAEQEAQHTKGESLRCFAESV